MKVDVEKFKMVIRSLNLGLRLARTVVLKLVRFFSIFLDYHKAPESSTNDPSVSNVPNSMPGTDISCRNKTQQAVISL